MDRTQTENGARSSPPPRMRSEGGGFVRTADRAAISRMEGEGNERRFTLSFSSEEPYARYFGPEILDHGSGAADLSRLGEIGCLLFNHNRDDVIGRVRRVWIENGRGYAEVEFDSDEKSETIYQKVKCGTLKGVSVGYVINSKETVREGARSVDGRFSGPCTIVRKWTPLEISIVSVPADATVGIGRGAGPDGTDALRLCENQIKINQNSMGG